MMSPTSSTRFAGDHVTRPRPLAAGFVFLGSRLLANQLVHSAPAWARSQFGCGLSGHGAKPVELRADGAILEHSSNNLEVPQGRYVGDNGLVVRVLAGASEGTSVVQHFPALPLEHIASDLSHLTPPVPRTV